MRKEWVLLNADGTQVNHLVEYLGIEAFLAKLLVNRGITDVTEALKYLNPDRTLLHDPFLMKDMKKAVKTIIEAGERGDSIVVFGDYDVDGVTSTALLYLAMKKMGFNVSYYIPLRLEEGYGLSRAAIEELYSQGHRLLITVDCGVTSFDEIEFAKKLGLKVVVTDHHEVKDKLPLAEAIVNPKRPDDNYPFKGLAGVGVAFKLLSALNETLRMPLNPEDYLDIVALGTIADIVPLRDENRFIVREGTKKIQKEPLLGLKILLSYLRINPDNLTAQDIAFKIAPKLNAAGRMDSAVVALELLISEDKAQAMRTASRLLQHNQNRQMIEAKIFEQATKEIESNVSMKDNFVVVLSGENWHLGVLGIVASRLVAQYNRPVFLISTSDGEGKGSARSPSGISIISLLNKTADILDEYGGHEMAAGFSIKKEKIPEFRKRLNEAYMDIYGEELPTYKIEVDDVLTLESISPETLKKIDMLRPFGHSNPEPKFLFKGLNIERTKSFGSGGGHIKMILRSGERKTLAVGFGMNGLFDEFKYVKPNLLKLDAVASIKQDNGYGIQGMKLSLVDARIYIDPVFEEEVRDKNFVFEFIRDWKNQKPYSSQSTDVSSVVADLEKKLSHKAPDFLNVSTRFPWGIFGSIRLKHPFLAWRILKNYQKGLKTVIVSSVNTTLAHTFYSLQHYLDPINPVYANSLYRGKIDEPVMFVTLPLLMEHFDVFKDSFDEIIFDEPTYIISGIYKEHPDLEAFLEVLPKILDKAGFTGSVLTDNLKSFLSSLRVSYVYRPAVIKRVGIIDNRGTRKKVEQVLSLVRHGENVAVVVDTPHKTVTLAQTLGSRLSHTLQNGELIFYNYLLKDFQRASIYSLVERQKIKVLISTPSNDGLGVMLGNSNIVFYNAPRSFLEILDAVTMKPGEESDLFLNLAFNKNDLLSNTNEIDRLFPTVEELQAIYQDLKDVLPASEKDVKRALGFEDGISRVYLSMLEDMGLVAYDADIWHIVKNKELSRDSVVKTLRYREGIAEKRMARWFASRLSTTTTRALLRSLMNGGEVLKIG
ncbi:single-stranded-DNA-specific exonuclease RecJ [Kosmotoga sp. DU53]|uniref:single-stranded-DNA-specific exonuclease RecJ n=1 Tax=Kosmotoga sp. DU53 TaxID=1310160 RepID=UPI0007C44195|nr:single-stranded-DNA-specific exonuclease RecJ [Kosmotoga sp. DU53]OAA20360.1 single-stranded DNA exonuclease RecJ [Kosmotoga sp. DU53]